MKWEKKTKTKIERWDDSVLHGYSNTLKSFLPLHIELHISHYDKKKAATTKTTTSHKQQTQNKAKKLLPIWNDVSTKVALEMFCFILELIQPFNGESNVMCI